MHYFYISPDDYAEGEKNGISAEMVYQRVYTGWSIQRAITQPLGKRNAHGWCEWKATAERIGIPYRTYLYRVTNGWSQEKAASTPPMTRSEAIKLMADSKEYFFTPEQFAEMKRNGITPRKAWQRVKKLGWSMEEAISTPIISREESLKRAQANNSFRKQTDAYWDLIRAKKKGAAANGCC